MRLKSIELTANITWSPAAQHPVYLATGTAAHQLDATFSTVSSINVYRLDLPDRSSSMPLVGSVKTEERYNQLIWGGYGMNSDGDRPSGVVVTAGDHGNLCVWDAAQLITDSVDDSIACIEKKTEHVGAVNALDFNAFQPNLLASGGADSEIYIWDLEKMDSPMTPGSKSQPPEDVLCLAWNRKVQHILASTFSNRCVVWDLRKNEPIIKVSDGMSRMKCKHVGWHPGVATQMCLSSEDDHTPFIQLWDLRFATSPVQSMEQHAKGVLAMAWCPRDPNILLSCGKDNQLICWNPNAAQTGGEIVYQAQLPSQWVFDVDWCPRNPGLIAASSFDGHVSLYSLMGGTSRPERTKRAVSESFGESDDPFAVTQQPPATQESALHMGCLRKAPVWMRPSCGARFAFGGKLVSWGDHSSALGSGSEAPEQLKRQVFVSQVVTEPDLISRAEALDAIVQAGKFEEYCTMKSENSKHDIEKDIWRFLKTSFAPDARNQYRDLLGYSKEDDLVSSTIKMLREDNEESSSLEPKTEEDKDSTAFDSVCANESIVQSLQCLHLDPTALTNGNDGDASVESALAMALISGRLEEAVELCLLSGQHGEALILAVSGGAALYRRAQERVLQRLTNDATHEKSAASARLIRAVVARDWFSVAELCGRRHWRAALACVLTYATAEELAPLCEQIGANLEAGDDASTALHACLCYICAGNADRLVKCWMRFDADGLDPSPLGLQSIVDKIVVLQNSMKAKGMTGSGDASAAGSSDLAASVQLANYASLLAGQGMLDVALHYLGDSQEESLLLLRDQIYRGMAAPPAGIPVPPCPFAQAAPAPAPTPAGNSNRLYGQPTGVPSRAAMPQHPTSVHGMPRVLGQPSANPPVSVYSPAAGQGPPTGSTYSTANSQPTIFTPAVNNTPTPPPNAQVPRSSAMPMAPSVLRTGRTASAGWNDPPPLKERSKPRFEDSVMAEAERNVAAPVNNYYNPAAYLPDPSTAPPPSRYPGPSHFAPAPGMPPPSMPGGYNAYSNSMSGQTQPNQPMTYAAPNFYTPAAPTPPPEGGGRLSSAQAPPPAPAPAQPKAPLPAEHQAVETVLNELLNLCKMGATSRQMKMKMDDVGRKLEALYDCIRQASISHSVLTGVHNIVAAIRMGDYNMAIAIINQIVETANFAEIRSFVPGLKVLMQSAAMMQIRVS